MGSPGCAARQVALFRSSLPSAVRVTLPRALRMEPRARALAALGPDGTSFVASVAYHEAGHCVMNVLEGAGIASAHLSDSLLFPGTAPNIIDGRKVDGWVVAEHGDRLTDLCFAAGVAAEAEVGLGYGRRDLHAMEREQIHRHLRRAHRDVNRAINIAVGQLRQCWAAVQAIATGLVLCGELSGEEATEIVIAEIPRWRLEMIA